MKENWDFDRDPLLALKDGDSGPFEAFVRSETPTFIAFFLRLGARRAEAEDLAQDLFFKLYRRAEHYQPKGRFAAFAFRVARNAWIDGRRRSAHRPPEAGGAEGTTLVDGHASPAEEPGGDLIRREEAQHLHAALGRLGEHHRLVFELGVLQELPYAEIAEMLDIPVGTVKSRMFHAVRKLREDLAGRGSVKHEQKHEHWSEEELVDAVLAADEISGAARSELDACLECTAKARELAVFLATCRAAFAPERTVDTERAALVAQSVLDSTTAEDLGWRGDLRLLRRFAASRWRASLLVRVAAASLLIHVAALPVLAYYGLIKLPESGRFFSGIEPRELPLPVAEEPEREVEVETDELEEIPDAAEVDVEELSVHNAIQWARFHMAQGAPVPREADATPANPVTRLLAERSHLIRTGEARATAPAPAAGPVVGALWVEYLLDRFVLERRVPAGFRAAIAQLGSAEIPAEMQLEAAALARAGAYDLLDRSEALGLEELLVRIEATSFAGNIDSLVSGDLRDGEPLDRAWIGALAAAAGSALADPVGRAWLGWGE